MDEKVFGRLRDWVEPAHPGVVHLYDDLISIYKLIREKYQQPIDRAFDDVSRQVGFVVATTLPVVLEVGEKGKVKSISMGADYLKGTLFEKAILEALRGLTQGPLPDPWQVGTYKLYVLWFEALKLKLRADWMEPAHFLKQELEAIATPQAVSRVRPEVMEPAHWFDPGRVLPVEEAVLISAIDEVYPELRLVDRLSYYRMALRAKVRPEVMEPAHFSRLPSRENLEELLVQLRRILGSM